MTLKLISGPFHPALEDALLRGILEAGPSLSRRVTVVTPSQSLSDHLQKRLALDEKRSFLNLRFHTLHSLASEFLAEDKARLVEETLFHDFLIRGLIPAAAGWGWASATRSSLWDLEEALVDPDHFREHFADMPWKPGEKESLWEILDLQAQYRARLSDLGLLGPAGLYTRAAERVQDFPGGLDAPHLFYGFYDMNGAQADFLSALARTFPTTIFLPYRPGRPAFQFVERFEQVKLRAGGAALENLDPEEKRTALGAAAGGLFDPESTPVAVPKGKLVLISASGEADELWRVAKEILRLRAEEKIAFEDIGVAARTLESHGPMIGTLFDENAIPLQCRWAPPLNRHPLAQHARAWLAWGTEPVSGQAFLSLAGSRFQPDALSFPRRIKEVLSSLETRAFWEACLGKIAAGRWPAGGSASAEEKNAAEELLSRAAAWDRAGRGRAEARTWAHWTEDVLEVLQGFAGDSPADALCRSALVEAADCLRSLDLLGTKVPFQRYSEALWEKWKRSRPINSQDSRGVRVMDAMEARGQTFKVLFLIGLKEGAFPRSIQEDPLLGDPLRRILDQPGGHWIRPKTAGYDEEKLLFMLLAASAAERLYAVYPRSGEEGRAEVPSLYLNELCRAAGRSLEDAEAVPRSPRGKLEEMPAELLNPGEMIFMALTAGKDPGKILGAEEKKRLDGTLARLPLLASFGVPTALDGAVPLMDEDVARMKSRGMSPTSLEGFQKCGYRWFAEKLLGLAPPDVPVEDGRPAGWFRGRVYHRILEHLYIGIAAENAWDRPPAFWHDRLEAVAREVFAAESPAALGCHDLVWAVFQEEVLGHLRNFTAWDREEILSGGFRPADFEKALEGPAPGLGEGWRWRGRPDRVDRHRTEPLLRVIDYKTRGRPKSLETFVADGRLLQPGVYWDLLSGGELAVHSASFYALEDEKRAAVLSADAWAKHRDAVHRRQGTVMGALAAGDFFIRPDEDPGGVCTHCSLGKLCRKTHGPSRQRAGSGSRKLNAGTSDA